MQIQILRLTYKHIFYPYYIYITKLVTHMIIKILGQLNIAKLFCKKFSLIECDN